MLELRPNCELCDTDLPANSTQARICSYECTFCARCVERLHNVCPNCGGGLVPRPLRPVVEHRAGICLDHQPASSERVLSAYSEEQIDDFVATVKQLAPEQR